jgi:hypothetical protein
MTSEQLEIEKRLTLNWLIQGASQHAGMTLHHLVRDELEDLDPSLIRLYDQFALINLLQFWQPDVKLLFGSPARFWKLASIKKTHPFYGHPLLAKYGGLLAEEARQRGLARCQEKGLTRLPLLFSVKALTVIQRLRIREEPHRAPLAGLAKRTAHIVWGIPIERLHGELVSQIRLRPDYPPARNRIETICRAGIVGLEGVEQRGDQLIVIAEATNWLVLAKELVKGTAELICLHGLNSLDDRTYHRVIAATDHLDLEPWMLQSGGELWRRFLLALPESASLAQTLMHLARLPEAALHSVMTLVIEQRPEATDRLALLNKS